MTKPRTFKVRDKQLNFPTFMPDGTYGYVRALTGQDLQAVGLEALMMNAFHLMQKPGSTVISALGGLHKMAAWPGVLMTDSGGFQAYSLIRQNPKFGSLTEKGITFYPEASKRKLLLTPEKSIQLQMSYGSDILVCLDDCTHIDASRQEQETSVELTIAWAKRAKKTFQDLLKSRNLEENDRPLLFGVVQGGGEFDLRKRCAEALLEIGFDGFGFGGWPLDSESNLITEILEYTRSLIPSEFQSTHWALGTQKALSLRIALAMKCSIAPYPLAMPATADFMPNKAQTQAWTKPAIGSNLCTSIAIITSDPMSLFPRAVIAWLVKNTASATFIIFTDKGMLTTNALPLCIIFGL